MHGNVHIVYDLCVLRLVFRRTAANAVTLVRHSRLFLLSGDVLFRTIPRRDE